MKARRDASAMPGKAAVLLLAFTALICSRATFALFDDPEGPNLLIVAGLAMLLFAAALAFVRSRVAPSLRGWARIVAAILVQTAAAGILFLLLR